MQTRRAFLPFSVLTLLAVGATLPTSAAVDTGLLALVPGDATVLSGLNVDQAKTSPYGRYILSQMTSISDPGFQKFIADTGFDPRVDLSQVLTAASGDSTNPKVVILGRGVFNPGKISNVAQADGATVTTYKGVTLVTHAGTGMTGAVAFLDATTAVMGYVDAVKAVIDRQGLSTPALPVAVVSQATALAAANDGWFLSTVSPATFFTGKLNNSKVEPMLEAGLMQSVVAGNGGLKFTATGAAVGGQAVARSPQDASALADVVKFLVNMVQSNQGTSPEAATFAGLLETMQVTTQGSTMSIKLNIPEAILEQMSTGSKHAARTARVARVQ